MWRHAGLVIAFLGCGGPGGTSAGTTAAPTANQRDPGRPWWRAQDPCPFRSHLAGAEPPPRSTPVRFTVAWYELVCMKDGAYHGPAVTFWPNGKVYSDGAYDNGLETGTWSFYYDTGELFARGRYDEGFAQPGWFYYQLDGAPLFWEPGGAGCPDGTTVKSDPAPEPAFDYWCEKPDGTKHGPATSWHSDWITRTYRDGNEHGPFTRWGSMDRIRYVYAMDDGWMVSETNYWGDHPFAYTEHLRSGGGDGRDHGVQKTWYPDGTLESEGTNFNGCRHGVWTRYDPTGTPVARATYDHCKLVSRDDLWHCVDAKHLLRADDIGGGVTVERIAGEPETPDYSTVRLHGGRRDVSLRLWKSNFDDSQGIYSWVLDQLADVDFISEGDTFAFQDQPGTYNHDPAVVFMDINLGAVALLTCPKPGCVDRPALLALAKTIHRRLLGDRWCVETIE
jgi:antitoxin component YwqK of YwqJK toxin-antitoxin module